MTVSEAAKQEGFKSAIELCEVANIKRSTLYNWHKNNRQLFDVVLLGAVQVKNLHSAQ
jgi:hypothetical protein